jgi:hypothetical protein
MKGGCLRKEENCNISFAMLEFQGEKVFLYSKINKKHKVVYGWKKKLKMPLSH